MLAREVIKYPYDSSKDKSIVFFSAGSKKDVELLMEYGITEILVSYHYLKKRRAWFTEEFFPEFKRRGGLFMLDSGVHTFTSDQSKRAYYADYRNWPEFLKEYTGFIKEYAQYIYCAVNLDLETILDEKYVDIWNKEYFMPLEKITNIIYVAHETRHDPTGVHRFTKYAKSFSYIGVNHGLKKYASRFYQIAKNNNVKVHGFAWHSLPLLKAYPMFSADSVSWLSGSMYGSTFTYDGKNFRVLDTKHKHERKTKKLICEKIGINFADIKDDKGEQVNRLNLFAWLGMRKEYMKIANLKLWNKPPRYYAKEIEPTKD